MNTTTTTTTTTNTSMNTHMATETTTSTNSSTSSDVKGREKLNKQKESERRRRNNIAEQYLRLKNMIPSIKNVEGIETNQAQVLNAFDKEAREQIARRVMLSKKIADIQQAIKNA